MTNRIIKRVLSLCLVFALITAMALTMVSCDKKTEYTDGTRGTLPEATVDVPAEDATDVPEAPEALGTFTLTVTFADGSEQTGDYPFYEEGTLGDFLIDNGIAVGEDGQYGLYIKTVLGESHDYNTDGTYWGFYVDGETAPKGVSETTLTDGAKYQLKADK